MTLHPKPRVAFTLLELIVVISIIVLLATLSTAAVMRVRDSQRETNTETQLRKIQMGFDQRWKATVDRIKMEDPPAEIINLTKDATTGATNLPRARALHMKLRLRAEFPQTFAECDPAKFQACFPVLYQPANVGLLKIYGPKLLFSTAIQNLTDTADNESAVLLYLILSQTGGGTSFDADAVGNVQPHPIAGNQPRDVKVFMDFYGSPIAFRRWLDAIDDPANLGLAAELSQPPFAPKGSAPDLQDPEGKLGPAQAAVWGPNRNLILSGLFISAVNARPQWNQNINPFDGLNRGPFVYSAGKDKVYGNENDLHSFRLQSTGQGN
jgi:hypothetical protein